MGFTRGTAFTTDAMFVKYGFEQELTNVVREASSLTNLQVGAVNEIVRSLKMLGIDPVDVNNTEDFEMEAIYWCLMTLYAGENPAAMPGQSKHAHYMKMWQMSVAARVIVLALDDGTTETITPNAKGLPKVANHDDGSFIRGANNQGEKIRGTLGSQFDTYVRNRKDPLTSTEIEP